MGKRTAEHNQRIAEAHLARGVGKSPMKRCPRCRRDLPREDFGTRSNGRYSNTYCPDCHTSASTEKTRRYIKNTPHLDDKRRANHRVVALLRYHGITVEDYERIATAQGHVCAICRKPSRRRNLNVDHCHATNVIRGALCDRCNLALGYFDDNPTVLEAAAVYLRDSRWPDIVRRPRVKR